MLFKLWSDERRRATWDLDLMGIGVNAVGEIVGVIRDVCGMPGDDGIVFDPGSVSGQEIRASDEYAGVRVRLEAHLAEARIPMQVDVGFGDAIVPAPIRTPYPTFLGHPAPTVWAYPREATVAEKLEAIVTLGVTTNRMKDLFDIQVLGSRFAFDGSLLAEAARATFIRRGTPLPHRRPAALTSEFLGAPERQAQWRAFLRRARLDAVPDAAELADDLWRFLGPVLAALGRAEPFVATWPPGGPWPPEG